MAESLPTKKEYKRPRFPYPLNGTVREDHAPASVLFRNCPNCTQEEGEETGREFQIMSFDAGKRSSVFRCSICGHRITVAQDKVNSAQAEKNKKE